MANDVVIEELQQKLEEEQYRYGWLRNEFLKSAQIIGKQQDEIDGLRKELREVKRSREMLLQEWKTASRQKQEVMVARNKILRAYDQTFIKGGPHLISIEVFLERLGFDVTGNYSDD